MRPDPLRPVTRDSRHQRGGHATADTAPVPPGTSFTRRGACRAPRRLGLAPAGRRSASAVARTARGWAARRGRIAAALRYIG